MLRSPAKAPGVNLEQIVGLIRHGVLETTRVGAPDSRDGSTASGRRSKGVVDASQLSGVERDLVRRIVAKAAGELEEAGARQVVVGRVHDDRREHAVALVVLAG